MSQDLPYELLELLRSLRGNPNQTWTHDPTDIKTIEALHTFEWKSNLIRGRDLSPKNEAGDLLTVSSTEAHTLVVKEHKATVVEGGQAFRVVFPREPTLGFVPWSPPIGHVLNDVYDGVFIPVVLTRTGQVAPGLLVEAGKPFWFQWGYVQRAGWQSRGHQDWRTHTFTILSLAEVGAYLCGT